MWQLLHQHYTYVYEHSFLDFDHDLRVRDALAPAADTVSMQIRLTMEALNAYIFFPPVCDTHVINNCSAFSLIILFYLVNWLRKPRTIYILFTISTD